MGITVQGLVKRYGEKTIIDDVSLDIADGELVSLLGPSGCGKTTTLRCIAGLEVPEAGRITIDGTVVFDAEAGIMVEPYHRPIGMVFQSYAIWPHLTVFENVAFPLRVRRMAKADIERKVMHALGLVGLHELRARSSQQLSGGQQQRVAVARAIVHEPAVLLFDEPLSNLDAKLRDQTRAEIRKLQRDLNVATVYVTHDQAEALSLSDRILVMREGQILQQGTPPEIYGLPANMFVADVVGAANFLEVTVTGRTLDSVTAATHDDVTARTRNGVTARMRDGTTIQAASGPESGAGKAMIRPDRLFFAGAGANRLDGVIRQRLFLGGHFEYVVESGADMLRVMSPVRVEEAARVTITFDPQDCIVLPP